MYDHSKPRVVFMGTPDFAVPALQALLDDGYPVVAVYSQPPRPKNRGHQVMKTPVHVLADRYTLPVFTPSNFKDAADIQMLADLEPDVIVVAAYGLLLPQAILDIPPMGCVNIHGSLLPRWRGAAPIHRAMMAGDAQTGITLMRMDIGLDTGGMIAKAALDLHVDQMFEDVHDAMSQLGADMLVKHLLDYCLGHIEVEEQPEEGVTYAHKITKQEGDLDWNLPRDVLVRQIRALNPWPSTHAYIGGVRLKIRAASRVLDVISDAVPGTLIDDHAHVVCGDGHILSLDILQREGGSPLLKEDFLRGFPLPKGHRFE